MHPSGCVAGVAAVVMEKEERRLDKAEAILDREFGRLAPPRLRFSC
jgi:hypothetical protein